MSCSFVTDLKDLFNHRYAKNVAFRDFARADAFPLFQATRDPDFNRFLLWTAPPAEADILPQADKLLRQATLHTAVVLSMCEKDTGTWVGLALLKPFRDGVELSLYLHPKVWNIGAVFTCGRAIIEVVFDRLPQTPVYTRVRPGNRRMEKICRAYRFEPTAPSQAEHAVDGVIGLDVYRLTRERWDRFEEVRAY